MKKPENPWYEDADVVENPASVGKHFIYMTLVLKITHSEFFLP